MRHGPLARWGVMTAMARGLPSEFDLSCPKVIIVFGQFCDLRAEVQRRITVRTLTLTETATSRRVRRVVAKRFPGFRMGQWPGQSTAHLRKTFRDTRRTRHLDARTCPMAAATRPWCSLETVTSETQNPTKNVGSACLPHCYGFGRHVTVT